MWAKLDYYIVTTRDVGLTLTSFLHPLKPLNMRVCIMSSRERCLINPLNAELNPICHLLVLLVGLTFMGPCIVSIFQYTCISNKMQHYKVYLYLETALRVLGGTCTHHQERVQLYLQHLVSVTPLLLSAAIVEELEPV
jgi:hypothetical protein